LTAVKPSARNHAHRAKVRSDIFHLLRVLLPLGIGGPIWWRMVWPILPDIWQGNPMALVSALFSTTIVAIILSPQLFVAYQAWAYDRIRLEKNLITVRNMLLGIPLKQTQYRLNDLASIRAVAQTEGNKGRIRRLWEGAYINPQRRFESWVAGEYGDDTVRIGRHLTSTQAEILAAMLTDLKTYPWHRIERIVFGNAPMPDTEQETTLRNPDLSSFTSPFVRLREVAIQAETFDAQQVEAFLAYADKMLGREFLKYRVRIRLAGDPAAFPMELQTLLVERCAPAHEAEDIVFGDAAVPDEAAPTTLCNPDVADFTLPMPHLKRIVIHTDTYDFHLEERFVTYAINHIGQMTLKKVEVEVVGNPEQLHPNLRNTLTSLCNTITINIG
jgi:hypothetical protein